MYSFITCVELCFLSADEVLATNWLFPANFTEVSLPDAVLSTSDFVVTSGKDQHMITVRNSCNNQIGQAESNSQLYFCGPGCMHNYSNCPIICNNYCRASCPAHASNLEISWRQPAPQDVQGSKISVCLLNKGMLAWIYSPYHTLSS